MCATSPTAARLLIELKAYFIASGDQLYRRYPELATLWDRAADLCEIGPALDLTQLIVVNRAAVSLLKTLAVEGKLTMFHSNAALSLAQLLVERSEKTPASLQADTMMPCDRAMRGL